jgi:hypothetical protein
MMPQRILEDLILVCATTPSAVWVQEEDLEFAYFNLRTRSSVVALIGRPDGLERVTFEREDDLRNWGGAGQAPRVYAWNFYTGPLYGYLAVYKGKTKKYIIKSFKKNNKFGGFFQFANLKGLLE